MSHDNHLGRKYLVLGLRFVEQKTRRYRDASRSKRFFFLRVSRGRRTPVSWTPPVGWSDGALPCGTPPLSHPLTPNPQRPPSWDPFTPSDSRSSPGSDQLSNIDPASAPSSQQVAANHHQFYNFDGESKFLSRQHLMRRCSIEMDCV